MFKTDKYMQITEYSISCSYQKPFIIALLADLHGKQYQSIVEVITDKKPDYIAIVGDVIDGDNDKYPLDLFRKLANISPSFFSLGNHERKISAENIYNIEKTGVVVLDNRWIRKGSILFGGMTSPFVTEWRETKKTILHYALPTYGWLDEFESQVGFKILLDHHPENYDRVTKNKKIDMILSGHAHGGQIRVFHHGIYAPHQGFFPKYTAGVYDNRLVVSRGLANNSYIPRLWNPPEVVFVHIVKTL